MKKAKIEKPTETQDNVIIKQTVNPPLPDDDKGLQKNNITKCDTCLNAARGDTTAAVLCFKCEQYLCVHCADDHLERYPQHTIITQDDDDLTWESKFERIFDDVYSENTDAEIQDVRVKIVDRIAARYESNEVKENDCRIIGLCMLQDDRLVVLDHNNTSIKVININNYVIEHLAEVSAGPWDVTPVYTKSDDVVNILHRSGVESNECAHILSEENIKPVHQTDLVFAVTFMEKKQIVLFKKKSTGLEIKDVIHLQSKCCALCYSDGMFFLACSDPNSFQIVTLTGQLLNLLESDYLGKSLFRGNPQHITKHPLKNTVFLTSYFDETIVSIDLDPDYADITKGRVPKAKGITTDLDGNLYICSWKTVYKVTDDLCHVEECIESHIEDSLIETPRAIQFHRGRLYLGNASSANLHSTISVIEIV